MKILALILCLVSFSAHAFINIEAIRRQAGQGFVGKSGLKWSGQRGNTNKVATNVSTLNVYRLGEQEMLFLGDYNYSYTNGAADTNNGRAHVRYTFWPSDPLSLELFAQSEFDQFKELISRNLGGANLRHRVLSTRYQSLFVGTGAFYEQEDWNTPEHWRGMRLNLYLSYVDVINERVTGSAIIYYQPAVDAIKDYRIQLQAGMEVMLIGKLAVDLQFSLVNESHHAPTVVATDVSYMAGVSWKY